MKHLKFLSEALLLLMYSSYMFLVLAGDLKWISLPSWFERLDRSSIFLFFLLFMILYKDYKRRK